MDYPKVQITRQFGQYNFTFRGDTVKEVADLLIEAKPVIDGAEDKADSGKKCPKCNSPMEYKSGYNKEKKKSWAGWFCTKEKSHDPIWD